jgi:hypothetical protein
VSRNKLPIASSSLQSIHPFDILQQKPASSLDSIPFAHQKQSSNMSIAGLPDAADIPNDGTGEADQQSLSRASTPNRLSRQVSSSLTLG